VSYVSGHNVDCERMIHAFLISVWLHCIRQKKRSSQPIAQYTHTTGSKITLKKRSFQPVAQYTHTTGSKITLPNTGLAHDKCLWTTASNFSQVRLCTPWWWISWDPKHVGLL